MENLLPVSGSVLLEEASAVTGCVLLAACNWG